ncbi:hypothetical protein [Paenibacillus piri]|uniref:Glycoside hydrolase family 5 domain-containing protein n=1 Tax=Paenibacillus piri TaxID=2547395 RepID=A0A4V2ZSE3_9BACL|nr:hypothetical protein [Paenibacillus piri]TDF92924.1 hypothetical protein E1757_27920 [Paenibacillus piri]
MGKYVLSTQNTQFLMNGKPFLPIGLRCSNSLLTEETTDDLIGHLDEYTGFGVNTISVFLMGSRFGNIKGYLENTELNPVYSTRLARIIEAADDRGMAVIVGCLYWEHSDAKWSSWTQEEANSAVHNTVRWLSENQYRNVIVDVDNEGMARRNAGFDNRQMVIAGKSADSDILLATNYIGQPPVEADVALHFSDKAENKPYIESEGTPLKAPGNYWHYYSKNTDPNNYYRLVDGTNYINTGVYSDDMKENQIELTRWHLERGYGYMLASTWLQDVPPQGPNHQPGGYGSQDNPGIRWWLKFIRDTYGA